LIDGLEKERPPGADLTTTHGDFHVDQLMMRDGGFVCLDFDGMCRAPAALDLATYAADVVRGRSDDVAQVEAVLAPLIDGYGRVPDDLEWYLRTAILCRATHPFRAQVPNWAERVAAMVAVADEVRL
jgi:Ser/Thr protein kinase RdoA (MazF antagonist)